MKGIMNRAASAPLPWGLVGMIGLVLAGEGYICRHELQSFTTNVAVSWRVTGRAVKRAARQNEILCFGDSMVKFGLEPRVLEQRLGQRTYNLALYAGPPSASYFLLRRAFEAGARPAAIVVDFQPHVLAQPPQYFIRQWPELATTRECYDLARSGRDASFFAAAMLARVLPSYRDRYEIRVNVLTAFKGQSVSASLMGEIPAILRNWNQNKGAQAAPKNPAYTGALVADDGALFPAAWKCDPVTGKYVRRFLRLAAERKVPVFWVIPPISPASTARREQMGLEAAYTAYVEGMQRQFPGVVVFDGRRSGYRHTVYIDPVHLDREGAELLSADVADLLELHLSGPPAGHAWAYMPAFRQRPSDVPLEDVAQSRVALKLP